MLFVFCLLFAGADFRLDRVKSKQSCPNTGWLHAGHAHRTVDAQREQHDEEDDGPEGGARQR